MSSTDLELIRRYADARDAEAFAELVARHRDMVYAACYRVLANRADAEDSTQECFLRLARGARSVRTSVAGWLHRVAVRTATAVRRKNHTRRQTEREAARMAVDGCAQTSWDEIRTEVDRAIDRLPDRLREPLLLHFLEGQPQTAVAQQLGLSQASVSRRVREGVEQLRRHLKHAGLTVSAVGLAGLLGTHAGEAAPATLVAELGRIALAGIGSGSAPVGVSASGIGLGAMVGSKATIACTVVTALAVVATVQYTTRRPGAPREALSTARAVGAASLPGLPTGDRQHLPDAFRAHRPLAATSATRTPKPEPAGRRANESHVSGGPAMQAAHATGASGAGALSEQSGHQHAGPTPARPEVTLIAQAPAGEGQPAPDPPATDMADPAAVVRAYAEACEGADLETALALTNLDEKMRRAVGGYLGGLELWQRDFGTRAVREYLLLPLVPGIEWAVEQATLEGDAARVTARPEAPELTFILARQEDDTWRIDLEASILATTQEPASVVFTRARKALGGPLRIDWRVRGALYNAGKHVIRYARETGRYPRAESWMDGVEAHCMVLGAFDVSGVLSEDYGLAMDARIGGVPYEESWPARRKIVGLYISRDTSRNAAGDPNPEFIAIDEGIEGGAMWLTSEEVVTVPHGMSADEAVLSVDHQLVSQRRIEAILRALLNCARDNGGKLPPADSWCDLASLYLPADEEPDEVFWCPATPELDCAWAINQDLAGKDIRQVPEHERQVLLLPAEAGVRNEARALPEVVAEGRYLALWTEGPRLGVRVALLNGETRMVLEGDSYPRPSGTGR